MTAMFDANVLISAARVPLLAEAGRDEEDYRCAKVVRDADRIRVSTLAWLEFCRQVQEHELPLMHALEARLHPIAVDLPIVERAIALMGKSKKLTSGAVCLTCGNAAGSHPRCSACGFSASKNSKWNDFIIVATAERERDVTVLYTLDPDALGLAGHVRESLKIAKPSSVHGDGLFRQLTPEAPSIAAQPTSAID